MTDQEKRLQEIEDTLSSFEDKRLVWALQQLRASLERERELLDDIVYMARRIHPNTTQYLKDRTREHIYKELPERFTKLL